MDATKSGECAMSDYAKTFLISFFTSLATAVIVYVFMSALENRVRRASQQPPAEPAVVATPAPDAPAVAVVAPAAPAVAVPAAPAVAVPAAPAVAAPAAPAVAVPAAPAVAAPAAPAVAPVATPVLLPDLTGKSIAAARDLLAERGLRLVLETAAHDSRVPADHVLQHEPLGGSEVLPGTEVRVVLSRGPALAVPQVVGMKLAEARTRLREVGFRVGEETQIEATAPADVVIAQTPTAGTEAASGASVALTVSRGPALAVVPNVRKRRVGVARKTLEDAGFVPGALTWTHNQDYEPGVIVRQQPAGGTRAPRGSEVRLWGSEPE